MSQNFLLGQALLFYRNPPFIVHLTLRPSMHEDQGRFYAIWDSPVCSGHKRPSHFTDICICNWGFHSCLSRDKLTLNLGAACSYGIPLFVHLQYAVLGLRLFPTYDVAFINHIYQYIYQSHYPCLKLYFVENSLKRTLTNTGTKVQSA